MNSKDDHGAPAQPFPVMPRTLNPGRSASRTCMLSGTIGGNAGRSAPNRASRFGGPFLGETRGENLQGDATLSLIASGTPPPRNPNEQPPWWPGDPDWTGVYLLQGWTDVHCHLNWASDYERNLRFQIQVRELVSKMASNDIRAAAVSGVQYNSSASPPTFLWELDEMAIWVASSFLRRGEPSPVHFFVFLNGFALDWDLAAFGYPTPGVPARIYLAMAESWLEAGEAKGFGELIVHGHFNQFTGTTAFLRAIYDLAARYDVPVQVHWDLGGIDSIPVGGVNHCCVKRKILGIMTSNGRTVEEQRAINVAEFKQVLEEHPNTKFILAHCGVGPKWTDYGPGVCQARDPWIEAEYLVLLDELLSDDPASPGEPRYPNLYLDIAGMLDDLLLGREEELTDLGLKIARIMSEHPERFLLGLDKESYDLVGYQDVVRRYREVFRQANRHAGLADAQIRMITRTNFLTLLGLAAS